MDKKSALSAPHLPLFDFFQVIRQWEAADLSRQALTTREYEWAVTALDNCPFELNNEKDYYRLCKLLWFKPYHADKIETQVTTKERGTEWVVDTQFENHFKRFWISLMQSVEIQTVEKPKDAPPSTTTPTSTPEQKETAPNSSMDTTTNTPTSTPSTPLK